MIRSASASHVRSVPRAHTSTWPPDIVSIRMRLNRQARPTFTTCRPGPSSSAHTMTYVIAYRGMALTANLPS